MVADSIWRARRRYQRRLKLSSKVRSRYSRRSQLVAPSDAVSLLFNSAASILSSIQLRSMLSQPPMESFRRHNGPRRSSSMSPGTIFLRANVIGFSRNKTCQR